MHVPICTGPTGCSGGPEFTPPGRGVQISNFLLKFLLKTYTNQPRRAHGPREPLREARISPSRLRPPNCSIPFKVSIKNGPESATEAPGAHGRLREPEFPPSGMGLQFGDFLLTFLLKTDPKQPRRAHGPPEAPGRPEFPPPGLGLPVGAFLLNLLLKTNPNQPRRQQSTGYPSVPSPAKSPRHTMLY